MLIDNGKLENEKEVEKKPTYGSSSSSEDSSASDENDDSDKAFLDAAEKGMLHSNEFLSLRILNEFQKRKLHVKVIWSVFKVY